MIDIPLVQHALPTPEKPLLAVCRIWAASPRDRVEGVIAYCLLGAVACAMLYIACMAGMFFTKA